MQITSIIGLVLTAGLAIPSLAQGQEKKIARADLPPAVERSVKVQTGHARLRGLNLEKDEGHTYYEAELLENGHHKDVLFDSTGAVVEVEEEVRLESLPASVQSALKAQARKGRITGVESLAKHGHLVAYEAQVITDGRRSEVQVGPAGEKLARPQ